MRGKAGLALMMLLLVSAEGVQANPYADVEAGDVAYNHIRQLSEHGLLNRLYAGIDEKVPVTRYEMAAATANASSKYNQAGQEEQAIIRQLQQEFAAELRLMGMIPTETGALQETVANAVQEQDSERLNNLEARQEKVEHKVSMMPNFHGEFKEMYDYWHSSYKTGTKSSASQLYTDVRLTMDGDINSDWKYLLGWQIIGVSNGINETGGYRTAPNLNYRNALNPDMQLYVAQIQNFNFYGGQIFIGKYWNGFNSNLEPTVLTDAFRGIGYRHPIGKVNLSASYGVIDFNPASGATYDDNKKPVGQRYEVDTTIGRDFIGGAYWRVKDFVTPQIYAYNQGEKFTRIYELQWKHTFDKNWRFDWFYGNSDAKTEKWFNIMRVQYRTPNVKNPGSMGVILDYHHIGANSVIDPGVVEMYDDGMGNGVKGFGFQFNYVPFKNCIWHFEINPWNRAVNDSSHRITNLRSKLDFVF